MGIISMHQKYVNGNLIFYNGVREDKWIDAIGPTVRKYYEDFIGPSPLGLTSADPLGWVCTALTGEDAATSLGAANEAGGALLISTDGTENDGINVYWNNEAFTLASGDPTYFGVRLKVSDADACDLFVGMVQTDAEMWGGIEDGIYFESADATAVCTFVLEKDHVETSDVSAGTLLDNTYSTLEWYYDGANSVKAYFDDVLVSTAVLTNIPDNEPLTFALELLTGATAVSTCTIDWIRVIQCQ